MEFVQYISRWTMNLQMEFHSWAKMVSFKPKVFKKFRSVKIKLIYPLKLTFKANYMKKPWRKSKSGPPWTHTSIRPSRCAAGKKVWKVNHSILIKWIAQIRSFLKPFDKLVPGLVSIWYCAARSVWRVNAICNCSPFSLAIPSVSPRL